MPVNGITFDWEDLYISIDGNRIAGVTSVDYTHTKEAEVIYGQGNKPIGVGKGKEGVEGSFTIKETDAEVLNILGMKPYTIMLVRSKAGVTKTTKVLVAANTEDSFSAAQGDMGLEHSVSFVGTEVREDKANQDLSQFSINTVAKVPITA